jgi:hypothetical protein
VGTAALEYGFFKKDEWLTKIFLPVLSGMLKDTDYIEPVKGGCQLVRQTLLARTLKK